jgi:peptidoglycan/xylan/chitin deacetylase (PgdA/CDA1 family)
MLLEHPLKGYIAKSIYITGILSLIRLLGRKFPKILVYHSIGNFESEFIKGCRIQVSQSRFEKHLLFLIKHYRIISLREFVENLRCGMIVPRTVVLTFDDGFADFFYYAYPVLKRYHVPATVFLVSDCVDNAKGAWLQEIYYLINRVGFQLMANTIGHLLKAKDIDFPPAGQGCEKGLENFLAFSLTKHQRTEVIERLYRKFGISKSQLLKENEVYLTSTQIRQMCEDGITFGNHGKSHTPLSAMSLVEQEREISESTECVHRYLDDDFLPFAYPFGGKDDFTPASRSLIIKHKHSCILTTVPATNNCKTSPFDLARIPIHDLPLYKFGLIVESWCLDAFKSIVFAKR